MEAREFLRQFVFGDNLLGLGGITTLKYVKDVPELPSTGELFFTPSTRKSPGNFKNHVAGTRALWVDCDNMQRPQCTLPPSAVVFSGHGWHLYWFLTEPIDDLDQIENANKILIADVPTADPACWNANRLMRVPGTENLKDPANVVQCRLELFSGYTYTFDDISLLTRLDGPTRHKIRTGDRRGYRSRSERDWAIVTALVRRNATYEVVERIFRHNICGDKFRDPESPEQYLRHTFDSAQQKTKPSRPQAPVQTAPSDLGIEESDEGYVAHYKRGTKRISTFTITPTLLLDGDHFGAEDAIVGDVKASGHTWKDRSFSRSAFTSVMRLDRECPVAAWQWLGRDEDVRILLPHLLSLLREKGLPRVVSVPVLGLHRVGGVPYFVGNTTVLSPENSWSGFEGPLAWLPSKGEFPTIVLGNVESPTEASLGTLARLLPQLNEQESIWPMLGWYAASALKPYLEEKSYRFPILSVSGTRGSGKTTLIQRVCMPLLGQVEPKSYDAGTTRFVMLSSLGSTNAIPLSFSEFRYESVERFLRYILLAYDSGHDPRGRADQTTVDYTLTAPFSVDGEDIIADPAARERVVVVHLHPSTVCEGSEAYSSYKQLSGNIPKGFARYYISGLLKKLVTGEIDTVLADARAAMFADFATPLPDRVRNNHVVALTGSWLLCDALGIERPPAIVMKRSVTSIFNLQAGRSRTLVDDFVEDVINSLPNLALKYHYDQLENAVWFQMATAYQWWVVNRRRQGRSGLEREAIVTQLKEAEYSILPQAVEGSWMYGVRIKQAFDVGLDIPQALVMRTMKLNF